jgi:hypothetical protein
VQILSALYLSYSDRTSQYRTAAMSVVLSLWVALTSQMCKSVVLLLQIGGSQNILYFKNTLHNNNNNNNNKINRIFRKF